MTSIHGGAFLRAKANPVVVVVVSTQRVGQFQRNINFSHADGVQPCRSLLRQPRAHVAVINPKALPEFFAVTAATNHFQKIYWQKEQEPDRPEQVVNETDHWIADCPPSSRASEAGLRRVNSLRTAQTSNTSVAPYLFRRTMCQSFITGRTSSGRFSKTKIPSVSNN